MGDHRPKITAHFEMHGHVADYDYGWCNWSPNSDGIDQRIVDWFREQADTAMAKYRTAISGDEEARRKRDEEARDRAEWERLQAKFGVRPTPLR